MTDYWTEQHVGDKIKELEFQLADLKAVYEANLLDAAKAKSQIQSVRYNTAGQ